jgi:hypothetical protein
MMDIAGELFGETMVFIILYTYGESEAIIKIIFLCNDFGVSYASITSLSGAIVVTLVYSIKIKNEAWQFLINGFKSILTAIGLLNKTIGV